MVGFFIGIYDTFKHLDAHIGSELMVDTEPEYKHIHGLLVPALLEQRNQLCEVAAPGTLKLH
jgi:hypothetical protein